MIDATVRYLLVGLFMTLPASSRTNFEPGIQPKSCTVTVYLNTTTVMPPGILLSSRLKAADMFREIGVAVRIRNGIPRVDPSDSCGAPIVLEIDKTATQPVAPGTLAYAMPYKTSGTCIHVLLPLIVQANSRLPFSIALLAHVMVHEISHVLQRVSRHSESGVMKAHWSAADYEMMEFHPLPFTPEDIDFIRMGLAARASQSY